MQKNICFSYSNTLLYRTTNTFLDFKDSGPAGHLTTPSSQVSLIVKITNSCVENLKIKEKNIIKERNILQKITAQVFGIISSRHPRLLSCLDSHIDYNIKSHRVAMIKKIIRCFLCIKLQHYCREYNQNELDKSIRRNMTKLILFQGQ